MSIVFESVSFSYPDGNSVLHGCSFKIPGGCFLLIGGQNGAGKSTLLRLMNGLNRPQSGRILINGVDTGNQEPSQLASSVAVTFQHPADQIFASEVLKEAIFGAKNLKRENPGALAAEALDLFGLGPCASMHPYDLSPALRRLLTMASAAATGSPVLAFDEPTIGLSQPERSTLRLALEFLHRNGRSLIIVSHDVEFFFPLCESMMVIANGGIAFHGSVAEIENRQSVLESAGIGLPLSLRLQRM